MLLPLRRSSSCNNVVATEIQQQLLPGKDDGRANYPSRSSGPGRRTRLTRIGSILVQVAQKGRTRRKWTQKEEMKLIEAMKDMVDGCAYRSDKGFKAGYLNFLEEALKRTCLATGFKAKSHIESKDHATGDEAQGLQDMLEEVDLQNDPNSSKHEAAMVADNERAAINSRSEHNIEVSSSRKKKKAEKNDSCLVDSTVTAIQLTASEIAKTNLTLSDEKDRCQQVLVAIQEVPMLTKVEREIFVAKVTTLSEHMNVFLSLQDPYLRMLWLDKISPRILNI